MDDRVRFVTHAGKNILLVDFSNCSPEQLIPLVDEVRRVVAENPKGSLLTLADFSNAQINKNVATRMKEVLTLDRPYVTRSAWVGTESLPKIFYENFKNFSKREFPTFASRDEAMEWLVRG
ncbi:MAG: hypothetical protein DMG68_17240 [Acidobacteria bacterium]|nr:MAG: hypothetical protein DMG68_17240 [Acidobacteriota bacterium]